jgi:hypothetical protein
MNSARGALSAQPESFLRTLGLDALKLIKAPEPQGLTRFMQGLVLVISYI